MNGRINSVAALATKAVQVLAPNNVQLSEHEFQRSPKEEQDAAREAAKLVKPGDLIFISTNGLVYSMGRFLTDNAYDHVVIVLDKHTVLHVGIPSVKLLPLVRLLLPQRQPMVLRVPMSEPELQLFLRSARQLIGCKYDIARASQLMLRLVLNRITGSKPLPRLHIDVKSNAWICSDSIFVLLAGCCSRFRKVLIKARQEANLDIFTHGSASMTDFQRIRRLQPDIMSRVSLPMVNYSLTPSWRIHIPKLLQFVQSAQNGTLRGQLLAPEIFSRAHDLSASISLKSWSTKRKILVLGYVILLVVLLRRGLAVKRVLLRAAELLILRFIANQVMLHLKLTPAFGIAKL